MAGRKPFPPTPDQRRLVELLAGFGRTHDNIRRAVLDPRTGKPIDEKTLRKMFRDELSNGRAKVELGICGSLLAHAKADKSGAVAIFLAKTLLGLKEHSLEGDAGPLTIVVKGGLPHG